MTSTSREVVTFGPPRAAHPRPSIELPPSLPLRREPLFEEIAVPDPFALYRALRARFSSSASFLLESAPGPERLAEFTFLGFGPACVVSVQDGQLRLDGEPLDVHAPAETEVASPLDGLRALMGAVRARLKGPWPRPDKYVGGLVGYVAYDFVGYLEPVLCALKRSGFPELLMGLYLDGVIVDHRRGRALYFSYGPDRRAALREALADAAQLRSDDIEIEAEAQRFELRGLEPSLKREAFCRQVLRAKDAIRAGDVYQLVLSCQLRGEFSGDLLAVYGRLRRLNPSPYMYHLDFPGFGGVQIAGSSPEMLLAVRGDRLITYPIAGTRPLGRTPEEEARYREELLSDEKEWAEHAMLVDLARNDLGRVARFGTVRVPEYGTVERFSHVQHLVSRVEGRLRPGCDALDAFASVFPAGTVTGAPKVRAMELIAELEPSPRGPYAGAVGYLSLNGDLDSAIAIRTLFAKGSTLYLQAGAGIVADSVPEREWREVQNKLGALYAALGLDADARGRGEEGKGVTGR